MAKTLERVMDPVDLYRRDISKISLLTPEEERTLAEQIHSGNREAYNRFVEANLRLVRYIARTRYGIWALRDPEIMAVGEDALMRAVENFDPDRQVKFSSYASVAILRAFNKYYVTKFRVSINTHQGFEDENFRKKRIENDVDQNRTNLDLVRETVLEELRKMNFSEKDIEIYFTRRGLYFLGRPDDRSFKKIGIIFNLSRSRVEQICSKMDKTLKNNPKIEKLYTEICR